MSTDYTLVNIVDSQIEDITSELILPVITGPKSTSYHKFNAQSNSGTTLCTIQLNIPSITSAVDRKSLIWSCGEVAKMLLNNKMLTGSARVDDRTNRLLIRVVVNQAHSGGDALDEKKRTVAVGFVVGVNI